MLVRNHTPGIPCASECMCVQAENTAEKWHYNSTVHKESTLESKQSPKLETDSQVYSTHSSKNSAVMMIFTLFEILCYVRYFQLPLLHTKY